MNNNTFQYYNGQSSKPYQVRIELIDKQLYLYDTSYNSDNGLSFSLSNCHHVVIKENTFIYLTSGATEYVVVPIDSEYYPAIIAALRETETGWYHQLLQQKWYVLVAAVIGLLGCIYLFFDKVVPPIALKFITVKEEISLGNEFYNSFTENAEVDSTKTFILQKFTDKLQLSDKYPIRVTVINDSIVNAFALPGGHLVVYTGIINKLENPQELAALLSHESSHVNMRHSLKSIVSRFSSSLLVSLATKDINGLSRGILNNVNVLRVLSYSRNLEKEADDEGMKLMVKNNINPIAMKWLMEDLQKLNKDVPSSISFLSTHPLTKKRITDADNFSKQYIQLNAPMSDVEISLWGELKR